MKKENRYDVEVTGTQRAIKAYNDASWDIRLMVDGHKPVSPHIIYDHHIRQMTKEKKLHDYNCLLELARQVREKIGPLGLPTSFYGDLERRYLKLSRGQG